ncbi:MAG TPA: response regulator [Candidatus Saccharimonadaceae bacterium]|jgi:diguanylate cyclase (GGDEF)-like protein|nr:response regulator [Candidatus Saccharimonadaceae bacterium]
MNQPKILVAEDELHLREVLRFQLESNGYQVVEAHDGQEAVERAVETLPDLILCDLMMPRRDGFSVCRELRSMFATRNIPIILLTAKSETTDKIQGLENGANDYITKPWESRELILRIRNVLEWSRQQRAANPLTGLPGNHSIHDALVRLLEGGQPFAMLQIDIDYFKAFNDYYGYARGDQAIQTLAKILVEATKQHGGEGSFVGHIGGDDFVVLTGVEFAEPLGQQVIEEFKAALTDLYDAADFERNYVEVVNRRHVLERLPLMSLTIALVSTDRMPVTHLAQLNDIAQELKAHGKGIPGSVLVGERRRADAPADADRNVA